MNKYNVYAPAVVSALVSSSHGGAVASSESTRVLKANYERCQLSAITPRPGQENVRDIRVKSFIATNSFQPAAQRMTLPVVL